MNNLPGLLALKTGVHWIRWEVGLTFSNQASLHMGHSVYLLLIHCSVDLIKCWGLSAILAVIFHATYTQSFLRLFNNHGSPGRKKCFCSGSIYWGRVTWTHLGGRHRFSRCTPACTHSVQHSCTGCLSTPSLKICSLSVTANVWHTQVHFQEALFLGKTRTITKLAIPSCLAPCSTVTHGHKKSPHFCIRTNTLLAIDLWAPNPHSRP